MRFKSTNTPFKIIQRNLNYYFKKLDEPKILINQYGPEVIAS